MAAAPEGGPLHTGTSACRTSRPRLLLRFPWDTCSPISASHQRCYTKYTAVNFQLLLSLNFPSLNTCLCSFYCFGPAVPPVELSSDENRSWFAHHSTPVTFNPHVPIEITSPSVTGVNLNTLTSTRDALRNNERVLILTPLRDAVNHLQKHFELILNLTYPHELIDLAFLVGDTHDETLAVLATEADRIQRGKRAFRSINIIQKDFGSLGFDQNSVEERHSFAVQGPRRKAMARARNFLLSSALKTDHSWVYWRDVDVVESPRTILEDFIKHDRDVLVPSMYGIAPTSSFGLISHSALLNPCADLPLGNPAC